MTSATSLLPDELNGEVKANLALEHLDNYEYVGVRFGSRSDLIQRISNADNWKGSNSGDFDLNHNDFNVSEVGPFEETSPTPTSPNKVKSGISKITNYVGKYDILRIQDF